MSRVVIPTAFRDLLQQVKGPVELCDSEGQSVGQFTPRTSSNSRKYWAPSPLTPEERRQIEAEPGYTPEEVWAFVEKQ